MIPLSRSGATAISSPPTASKRCLRSGMDCVIACWRRVIAAAALGPPESRKPLAKRRDTQLSFRIALGERHQHADTPHALALLRARRERPRGRAAKQRDELAAVHVWMAPAWQEIIWRAAQRSLAVMCPACSRSPEGLLALMESANRGLITRAGSMSR